MQKTQNCIFMDIDGLSLTEEDACWLSHPLVGGLVLFARNFNSKAQLQSLTKSIAKLRPDVVIAVDHEGGRVQRFKEGFTHLPPMARLGELYDQDPKAALAAAFDIAALVGSELIEVGIDLSLSPVLDLNYNNNSVIGDRAFHADPNVVAKLACQFMKGLQSVGMQAVAKHFPGHGYVALDSHVALPVDNRAKDIIINTDCLPFKHLIDHGLNAVMPAHIIYEQCDSETANFSQFWLKKILREQLGFQGFVLSDDMHMQGASSAGDMLSRTKKALNAGCDGILICNDRAGLISVLTQLTPKDVLNLLPLKASAAKRDALQAKAKAEVWFTQLV